MSTHPRAPTRLPSRTRRALQAFAEAYFARQEGELSPPTERLVWVMDELDDLFGRAGWRARLIYRLALFAVSVAAPLFIRKPPTLRFLSIPQRVEAITRMEQSPIAAPVLAVKAMLCILFYEHPDSAREVGYVGVGARVIEAEATRKAQAS